MRIKVLPDTVINQIAAGEVVERPASVVRELVDNSVDAGATDIFVALESGGHSRIRVRDNGCGMTRAEAVLAFERHATSKVTTIEDLTTLTTMGFRGEALASIASVSKVRLITRSADEPVGVQVTMRGGKLTQVESASWPSGTEIEIEHLFFNTPARRKFLKSPRSEVARIRSWLAHASLVRPGVRYRLVADGEELLHLAAVASRSERGRQVFGANLIPVTLSESGVMVEGMIGHPGDAVADATGLVVIVNGRVVSDRLILKAVREGYDSMLKDREFPVGYLVIDLPPEDLDVNVHPQKSEVRFRRPDQIFAVVSGAVLAAVRSIRRPHHQGNERAHLGGQVPPNAVTTGSASAPSAPQRGYLQPSAAVSSVFAENEVREHDPLGDARVSQVAAAVPPVSAQPRLFTPPQESSSPNQLAGATFRFSELRYIGQVLECFLLCEGQGTLVVVDMHAAHERVNYNKIRAAKAQHSLTVQRLLIPEVVRLPTEQVAQLQEQMDLLRELACEVEVRSHDQIVVTGIPGVLSHLNCVALIKECAVEPVPAGWRERLEERIDHIAARLACHASIRSGDRMTPQGAQALFRELDQAEVSGACPHGRPVVAEFSRTAVERWFGRDR